MHGLTMDPEMRVTAILRRAERHFRDHAVVTRGPEGSRRSTWGEIAVRSRRLASAIEKLGGAPFDRIATFAWNTRRHVELYYAAPGARRIVHTLNLRLHPDQVAWIVNHAEDRVIFVDDVLLPVLEAAAGKLDGVKTFVVMGDGPLPESKLGPLVGYEELLASGDPGYDFPDGDEKEAALLCYTSGTTGNPKGVLYGHRGLAYTAMTMATVDNFAIGERDTVLATVPMFHAAGWCLPYVTAMTGAKLVLPGRHVTPPDILAAIDEEAVTFTAGVPTVWSGVADHVEREGRRFGSLDRIVCAGSALPAPLVERYRKLGVRMWQAWGMTECLVGTISHERPGDEARPPDELAARIARQGIAVPWVDLRIVDPEGNELPADGATTGELELRGPVVATGYFGSDEQKLHDGWFPTGDVASIDPTGVLVIRDRTKDVIKSGGEWISSLELEAHIAAHPAVADAAIIARPDPRWVERPLACVVLRPGASASPEELGRFLAERVARWWVPESYAFIEAVPRTSVGKVDKKRLREQLAQGELTVTGGGAA